MDRIDPSLADHLVRLHNEQLLDDAKRRRRLGATRRAHPAPPEARSLRHWAGTILVWVGRRLAGGTAAGPAVIEARAALRGVKTGV